MFNGEDLTLEDFACTDWTPLQDVQADFDAILKAFENTNSVRYETFLKIWLDMHFDQLYAGRQNERECREVSKNTYIVALSTQSHLTTCYASRHKTGSVISAEGIDLVAVLGF